MRLLCSRLFFSICDNCFTASGFFSIESKSFETFFMVCFSVTYYPVYYQPAGLSRHAERTSAPALRSVLCPADYSAGITVPVLSTGTQSSMVPVNCTSFLVILILNLYSLPASIVGR